MSKYNLSVFEQEEDGTGCVLLRVNTDEKFKSGMDSRAADLIENAENLRDLVEKLLPLARAEAEQGDTADHPEKRGEAVSICDDAEATLSLLDEKRPPAGTVKYVVMEAQKAERVEYRKHEFYAKPGLTKAQVKDALLDPETDVTTTSYGEPSDSVLTGEMKQVLVTDTKSEDEAIEEAANVLSSLGLR